MSVHDNGAVVRYSTAPAPVATVPLNIVHDPQFLLPGTYNFSVYRGDTYEWWFVLGNLGSGIDPQPLDIGGWRFKAEIRASPDSPLMASMQEVARDDAAGIVAMRLTNQQSRLITASGFWDLEAITPEGWVRTVLRGNVTLISDVTTGFVEYSTEYPNAKAR